MGADHCPQLLLESRPTGHIQRVEDRAGSSGVVGHVTARLQNDHHGGSDIPRCQAELPIPIESTTRHPGQVEGCRAQAADPSHLLQHRTDDGGIAAPLFPSVVGEAGGDHPVAQRPGGYGDGLAVQPGSRTRLGHEGFLSERVNDYSYPRLPVLVKAHGHRDLRYPVMEVDGAIEWVDDPMAAAQVPRATAFFGENRVVWPFGSQDGEDGLLGPVVDLGDRVNGAFELHRMWLSEPRPDNGGTGLGGGKGYGCIVHRETLLPATTLSAMLIELAPILSALLMWAAFPPLGWGVLAIVAPTPLLAALRRVESRRGAALIGFSYGVVFYSLLVFWVKETGFLSLAALVLLMAGYSTVYALLVYRARNWGPTSWWLMAVGGWALVELVRLHLPFGGFSWGLLGYPAGEYQWLRGATHLVGTTGWSVIFMAVAAGLTLFVTDRRRPASWLAPSLAMLALLTAIGAVSAPTADGVELRVAIIQGNSPCPGERCVNENEQIFQSHLELTRTLSPQQQVQLVVWPESSAGSTVELSTHPGRLTQVRFEARRLGSWFLIGSQRTIDDDSFTNLNVLVNPDGEIVDEYWKRHPVPFGEYVPWRPLFDWIPALDQVPRDLVRGTENTVFELPTGMVGSVISFEGAFPRSTRPQVREGAEVLVVATNKASFGDSPVSDQFIGMTRMRAAELGTAVVHAAITGKSAFIDADGTILSETEAFQSEVLIGTVGHRSAGLTLYARLGDWVQYLAVAAALAVGTARWLRKQEGRRSPAEIGGEAEVGL